MILCILKGKMPFKMHKLYSFPEKKIIEINKKYVCLPYLKFSDPLAKSLAFLFFSAQAAIDRIVASSAKPSSSHAPQPAQPVQVEQQEVAQDQESQAATENMLATQNDMLNTVTQLLQQTDSVTSFIKINFLS